MLTILGVKALIEEGRPEWITKAEKETAILQVHVNGIDADKYLEKIDIYENERQSSLRKKYFTSNRFLFENLLRHVDKVFTAQGGSKFYNISERNKTKLSDKLNSIRHGKPIRKWISSVQANKYYSDPSGLVFFEWTSTETYPTIKSISSIYNYKANGRSVDWIIFQPEETNDGQVFRVVDEKSDRQFLWKNDEIKEIDRYSNPWGYVPAIINSDILSPTMEYFESPIQPIIELADKYLRTNSIKNVYEFLHGFPLFWAYAPKCKNCDGTGKVDGETCPVCLGDGNTFRKDVTDILKLRPPGDTDEPKLAPDVAGYVEPDSTTWTNQRTELDWLWKIMHFTLWGTLTVEKADRETALGRFLDIQPVNDRLSKFTDAFEYLEERMTEIIGTFYFRNFKSATVNYGRIYMTETPDDAWNRYSKARSEGVSKVLLNHYLLQYYQSEFVNDSIKLLIYTKAIAVEPFVHKTDEEVIAFGDDLLKKKKIYFNEWWASVDQAELISSTAEQLKISYKNYLDAII